eukprot:CAMPEP_0118831584 /NCGR_PEP_ID=MMETSP1162-20130426/31036_1 /TAXON_ID=33656 /ORGANISM="Phaeocystis Sp, Strain CCMP2710" /LENGTH=98 /DNA_ID=CAMNT_0006763021 /DNA_START=238 /DNA_END=535 /DNA_ORIENTATION=+
MRAHGERLNLAALRCKGPGPALTPEARTPSTGGASGASDGRGGARADGGGGGGDGAPTVLEQPRAIVPALAIGVRGADLLPLPPQPYLHKRVTKPAGS